MSLSRTQSAQRNAIPAAAPEGGIGVLFDRARERYALLDGAVGAWRPDLAGTAPGQEAAIEALYLACRDAYPDAGPAYWATRSWNMLVWQPSMLAVLAVHECRMGIHVDRLLQRVNGTVVAGFALPEARFDTGEAETLVDDTASRLRVLSDGLYDRLTRIAKVKRLNAERLLADRLLGLLAHLADEDRAGCDGVQAIAARWLAAAGLGSRSRLVARAEPGGGNRLHFERGACCLHYLVEPNNLCAACPKVMQSARRQRRRDARA